MKTLGLIIFSFIFISTLTAFSQIEIEFKSGVSYRGVVTHNTKDSISINTFDFKKLSFHKKYIEHIEPLTSTIRFLSGKTVTGYITQMTEDELTIIVNNNVESDIEHTYQRKDIIEMSYSRIYKDTYGLFGLTFGLPGGINALWGYHFGKLGARAELGFFPGDDFMGGVQANFLYNIYQNRIFETNISLGAGYFTQGNDDFAYIGPFYDINLYGFFLELGVGFGSGKFTSPQFLAQIGYVYRFN